MSYRRLRKVTQFGAIMFMFITPILSLYEIYAITGSFYAVNVGGLGIADPSVILQAVFAVGSLTVPLAGAALFPIALALLFGRIWCGWLCPYHTMADGVAFLRRKVGKVPADKDNVGPAFRNNITRFGFLTLGVVVAGAIGIPVLNYVNAPGIISTEALIFVKEHWVSVEILFIAAILLLELTLLPRFWCRMFCPTGAVISLFARPSSLHVSPGPVNPQTPCCKDAWCVGSCPMGLIPYRESRDRLCTNCGLCVDACRPGRMQFRGFTTDAGSKAAKKYREDPS